MTITIKTKFSQGDVVYGYYNGKFWKFRVDFIKVSEDSCYCNSTEISYRCTAIVPIGSELTFSHQYDEQELFTKEELVNMLENIIND